MVAGGPWVGRVFELVEPRVRVEQLIAEGAPAERDDEVFRLEGPLRGLLIGERVALNLLGRLSGIATLTRSFVEEVEAEAPGTTARVTDTRKTTPGLRTLEKHAVRMGGGSNHRFSLSSGVLIKENHIAACGSVAEAIRRARHEVPHSLKVEVEVTGLEELGQALEAGADAVLLDNMDDRAIEAAVRRVRSEGRPVLIEASGELSLERIGRVAALGVDLLSVGALTHSARSANLSMQVIR